MKPKINKTSWKSRNFLKVKVDDVGGRVYNDYEVPAATINTLFVKFLLLVYVQIFMPI